MYAVWVLGRRIELLSFPKPKKSGNFPEKLEKLIEKF
jgi:hypothetical protein